MDKYDKNKEFLGSDWKEYSTFELAWLEVVLTKKVLNKKDIEYLLKKNNISFTEKNVSQEEMGDVLINDVIRKDLLPDVKKVIENYPYVLSFNEAKKIYDLFYKLDFNLLYKIILNISSNKHYCDLLRTEHYRDEIKKDDMLFNILKEFYSVGLVV